MRRLLAPLAALALCLGFAGAQATPIFHYGGSPGTVVATAWGCDGNGTGVCADHSAGQTFVQWTDSATGASGNNFRYRVYRKTSPINSGNYTSATLIASYVLNNSAQLVGGDPNSGGSPYTQATRQNASVPMEQIPNAHLGGFKTPSSGTGVQVYTALGSATAYYAVVSTDLNNASPAFIGSVGPIAETAAPQQGIQYAHRTTGYGHITASTAGLPLLFAAHQSGGCTTTAPDAVDGDFYEWFGDTTEGWQDGPPRIFTVLRDGVSGTRYPSFTGGVLLYEPCGAVWNSVGTGSNETLWLGLGLTPNPLVGSANRLYRTEQHTVQKQIAWLINQYGADPNQVNWQGISMGAWGGAISGLHMKSAADPTKPMFASIMVGHPIFRFDLSSWSSFWAGTLWGGTVASPWAFAATLGNGPSTLGNDSSALLLDDGSNFGTYANTVSFISSTPLGTDLPFFAWAIGKDDGFVIGGFATEIAAMNAFQTTHRGHAFTWYPGAHDTGFPGGGTIMCDYNQGANAIAGVCYGHPKFQLTLPYIAFDSSSIDDNPGTGTRNGVGIYDGDPIGAINAGFTWNVTSDTAGGANWVAGNNWMTRSPTPIPSSTISSSLASSGTATFTVTDTSTFLSTAGGSANVYFLIGGTEIVEGTLSGNTITIILRHMLGTSAFAHSPGESIVQYPSQATGPNGGPYATMTVNMTPRRLQNFKPADGTVLTCTITPFGAGASTQTPTVTSGIFTLIGVTINSGGNTSVACI